ncbi:MAG: NAD-dependent epimerase/dehydratase family protein [Puniceicoccales bacterium]|jgi:UDP-glucose 4-epimerase|nr:NAD-dependent epimerase/dehydratase family protein [Puniceicoccales bacterium]
MRVLVIGGAGYLGSHVVRRLLANDVEVSVIDNFSTGQRDSLPKAVPIFSCDAGLIIGLEDVLKKNAFDVAIHCAGLNGIGRSLEFPFHYYHNNFVATYYLLQTLIRHRVQKFLFSSDFSVYGPQVVCPIEGKTPKRPWTPLGRSLVAVEELLKDLTEANGLHHAILRVGNIAGADPSSVPKISPGSGFSRLLATIFEVAQGKKEVLPIHGSKLPTEDGTPMRDYVHVVDVADAYVKAIKTTGLENGAELLLGTGRPSSVLEVVAMAGNVVHRSIATEAAEPRKWEPASTFADPSTTAHSIGWFPTRGLREIVESSWRAINIQ